MNPRITLSRSDTLILSQIARFTNLSEKTINELVAKATPVARRIAEHILTGENSLTEEEKEIAEGVMMWRSDKIRGICKS